MGFLVKVSDLLEKLHQICWFSGCDLHLPEAPGLSKVKKKLQKFMFLKMFWDFLKILCCFWLFIIPT